MKVSLEFPEPASLTQFDPDYLKAVFIAMEPMGRLGREFQY